MNLFQYAISEPLAMDEVYAFNLLAEYNNVMSQVEAGVPFDRTGYAEKKSSQKMSSMSGIAHMRLSGFMQLEGSLCSRGVNELIQEIYDVNRSSLYNGILLEIESGGGQSLAGQALKNAIKDSVLPVVVYGHVIGSAAYHASIHASEIMLSGEGASAGSIGTYITLSKSMMELYNKEFIDLYAEQSTEKNKAFRLALAGDYSGIQKIVNENAKIFQKAVEEARPLKGDVKDTLSGGMFNAVEAKKRGLVDSIGTFNDAVEVLNYYIKKRKK